MLKEVQCFLLLHCTLMVFFFSEYKVLLAHSGSDLSRTTVLLVMVDQKSEILKALTPNPPRHSACAYTVTMATKVNTQPNATAV